MQRPERREVHEAGGGKTVSKYPSMFFKSPNCFVALYAPILLLPQSGKLA